MANMDKIINFTEAEVNSCSSENEGVTFFVSDRHPIEGKRAYTEVLFPKLVAAVQNRSDFSMAEKPKKSGKSNGVLYVFCNHLKASGVRQGAFYKLNQHKLNQPLELTYRQSCLLCEGINPSTTSTSTIAASTTTSNIQDMPFIILGDSSQPASAEFIDAVQKVDNNLVLFIEDMKQKCLQYENPMNFLRSNMAQFGIEANRIVVNTILDGAPEIQSTLAPAIIQEYIVIPATTVAETLLTSTSAAAFTQSFSSTTTAANSVGSISPLGEGIYSSLAAVCYSPFLTTTAAVSQSGLTTSSGAVTTVTQIHSQPLASVTTASPAPFTSPVIVTTTAASITPIVTTGSSASFTPSPSVVTSSSVVTTSPSTAFTTSPSVVTTTSPSVVTTSSPPVIVTTAAPIISTVRTSVTPVYVTRSLRSAERVATEAALVASGDTTPKLGGKRSGRALFAQNNQRSNIQKKSRGL